MPKAVSSRERCFDGVREVFECDESQSNSPVQEGKSDCGRRRSRANMHAFCQGNIGHVFNVNSDTGGRRPRKEVASEGGVSAIPPTISAFSTRLIFPVVTYLSHSLQHVSQSCCVHLTIHPNAHVGSRSLSATKTAHTHLNTHIHLTGPRQETSYTAIKLNPESNSTR